MIDGQINAILLMYIIVYLLLASSFPMYLYHIKGLLTNPLHFGYLLATVNISDVQFF